MSIQTKDELYKAAVMKLINEGSIAAAQYFIKNKGLVSADYIIWLAEQDEPHRQESVEHLEICRLAGEEARRAPFSDEMKRLRGLIRAYYEKYPE